MTRELLHGAVLLAVSALLGCDSSPAAKRYEFREDKTGHLLRLDTSTGEASIADDEGSRQLLPPEDSSTLTILGREELAKITGNGACNVLSQRFEGRLYNGTGVVLRTVGIAIVHKKSYSDEVVWNRPFIVRDVWIRPLEVKSFVVHLTGVESAACDWMISHAYGSPWPPRVNWWDRLTH